MDNKCNEEATVNSNKEVSVEEQRSQWRTATSPFPVVMVTQATAEPHFITTADVRYGLQQDQQEFTP